jgi:hypothetical protein
MDVQEYNEILPDDTSVPPISDEDSTAVPYDRTRVSSLQNQLQTSVRR